MVKVELMSGSPFYIDSTEVTVRQYKAFLDAKGNDSSGQPAVCSWNTHYDRGEGDAGPPEITAVSDLPMTYVDWCDAYAYCAWAGKRLCGKIGGGVLAPDSHANVDLSEWGYGCGGPNYNSHASLDPAGSGDNCNNNNWGDMMAVGTTCEGSVAGLFEMQGNAAEWVDSCRASSGAEDFCMAAGTSFLVNVGYCNSADAPTPRNSRFFTVGFRCCSS